MTYQRCFFSFYIHVQLRFWYCTKYLLTCASCSRSVMQSTLNCLTTAFLGSHSMRGCWGWRAHQVTRLQRSDQALCMMRRCWLPLSVSLLSVLVFVTCASQMNSLEVSWSLYMHDTPVSKIWDTVNCWPLVSYWVTYGKLSGEPLPVLAAEGLSLLWMLLNQSPVIRCCSKRFHYWQQNRSGWQTEPSLSFESHVITFCFIFICSLRSLQSGWHTKTVLQTAAHSI